MMSGASRSPSLVLLRITRQDRHQRVGANYRTHQQARASSNNSSNKTENNKRLPSPTSTNTHDDWSREWFVPMIHRLAVALGFSYCFAEYVAELTLCEGPSMMPTIYPQGELILVDRFTHRLYGLHHGNTVQERLTKAQDLQKRYKEKYPTMDVWYATTLPRIHGRTRIPATNSENHSATTYSWRNVWKHKFASPLSVGDVVVVQHPHRPGTVCKRILGLPGDTIIGAKQTTARRMGRRGAVSTIGGGSSYYHHQPGKLTVIPDGHVWLEGDNPRNSADSRTYGPVPARLLVGRVLLRVWPLRGRAWMERGQGQVVPSGTTILPAGYDGETMESVADRKGRMKKEKKLKQRG